MPESEVETQATGIAPGGDLAVGVPAGPQPAADSGPPGRDGAKAMGPLAILGEGFTLATGSSRLLRRASIYIGLLMLALAGPGVVAGLSIVGSVDLFDPNATFNGETESAIGRAVILLVILLIGSVIALVEGTAIGIALLAARVLDRAVPLSAALQRSRKVFWRIVRAGLIVGALELAASHLWQVVTGNASVGDLTGAATEPIVAAVASLPFLYATVAIVLADDGARASLRRSVQIARDHRRLTVALGAFGLLSGVVQGFALGSGLDLIVRVTDALHLDITAGGLSFFAAAALALAIVMAAGSLLFTVTAIVNAPQVVAWSRLGLPVGGLVAATPAAAPAPEVLVAMATAGTAGPEAAVAVASEPAIATQPLAAPAAAPLGERPPAAALVDPPPAAPLAESPWGPPPEPAPNAWAIAAAAEAPFRWVTIPMRLTVAGMWLIAIASLIASAPT